MPPAPYTRLRNETYYGENIVYTTWAMTDLISNVSPRSIEEG